MKSTTPANLQTKETQTDSVCSQAAETQCLDHPHHLFSQLKPFSLTMPCCITMLGKKHLKSLKPFSGHLAQLWITSGILEQILISFSPMNQFLLMLAKLRQDVDYLPLSRMCNISVFTVENVSLTWINFCSRQWGEIDMWLSQELVRYFA